MKYFQGIDIGLGVVYLLVISFVYFLIRNNKKQKDPIYRFYMPGLLISLFAGVAYCVIFAFYYEGVSDTIFYFRDAKAMSKIFLSDFPTFMKILFGDLSRENFSVFTAETGYMSGFRDAHSFAVKRFSVFFVMLGFNRLIPATLLLNAFLYVWNFRLFRFVANRFPQVKRRYLFLIILAIPSVVYWGSGMLKDSFTFSAICLFVPSFFELFEQRKRIFANIFNLLFSAYLIIALKPYIVFAALLALGLGFIVLIQRRIRNTLVKWVFFPLLVLGLWVGISSAIGFLGESVGGFYRNPETMLKKAQITQQDLIRDQYGENSFNIGKFEASYTGVLRKFPQATIAGLFRPFLWEAGSIFVFVSALENTIILMLTLLLLVRVRWRKILQSFYDPLMAFSFVFALNMAFVVGLTTANFGALVRYKIPLVPFFLLFVVINILMRKQPISRTPAQSAGSTHPVPDETENKIKEA